MNMDTHNIYKYLVEIFDRNIRFQYSVPIFCYHIQHNRTPFANNVKLLIFLNIHKKSS